MIFDKEDPLISKKEYQRTFDKALFLLDYAPQTSAGLKDKLIKKDFQEELIDRVIVELQNLGFLNDREYAHIFGENLITKRYYGRIKVVQKLISRGIHKTMAREITNELYEKLGEEKVFILKYLEKKRDRHIKMIKEEQEDKIKGRLYRRGYSLPAIIPSLKEFVSSIETEIDE